MNLSHAIRGRTHSSTDCAQGGLPVRATDAYVHDMPQSQIRRETLIVREGLLISDPQHVWQVAAQKAQELAGDGVTVLNVELGTVRPADFTDNSTDREIEFSFRVVPD